jgi:hypothetical protein
MGVDAKMFVRLKGKASWLKPEDVLKASYEIASTIGSDNFLITAAWTDMKPFGKPHHELSIVEPWGSDEYETEPELQGKIVWSQDGDPIVAAPDEQFVSVHLSQRYYGEDYARGDWPVIRSTIEWLQKRFPAGEVWYGGDSSGICAEHMTSLRVAALNNYFLESGRRSYTRYESGFSFKAANTHKCPTCEVTTIDCGGGRGQTFLYCDGCGRKFIRVDSSGAVVDVKRGTDFFEASSALENVPSPTVAEAGSA